MSRRFSAAVSIVCFVTAFAAQAEMTGVVMTRDGAPVGGATVTAFALESSAAAQARLLSEEPDRVPLVTGETNRDGVFRLDADAAVGEVMIHHPGFAPEPVRMMKNEDVGAIALMEAGTKAGRVTGPGGSVPNARVVWRGRHGGEVVAVTDDEGRYSVPDPAKWTMSVTVIAAGHAIFEEMRFGPPVTKPPKADVRLEEGVTITGHVVAADGKTPVAGAAIQVDGWPMAVSLEDGTFVAPNVPSRWTEVRAIAGETSASRTRRDKTLVLRLERTPRLSGIVRDGDTRAPLEGVEVRVMERGGRLRGSDESRGQRVMTDARGNFSFELPPGSYSLDASVPDYDFTSVRVSITQGAQVQRVMSGARLGSLIGTVLDEDRQGVAAAALSPGGAGDSGFGPMGMMPGSAWSAPDGRFVLRGLPEFDDLRFRAVKKGFPAGETDRLALAGGETKRGVVITIPRGIEVTGIVTDADGVPLSGVAVSASPASPGGRGMFRGNILELMGYNLDRVMTGGDGRFSMRVKGGSTDFAFKLAGYAGQLVNGVDVEPGAAQLEVTMEPGAVIEGRVERSDGSGVDGVNVGAYSQTGMHSAFTLPDGSFLLEDLTPGPMMLTAHKEDDFIQQMRQVTAPSRDVVIKLPPGETVSGSIVDKETGEPVKDFQAGFQNTRQGGRMRVMGVPNMRSFRDDEGAFLLERVPVGPIQLRVTSPGYVDQTIPGLVIEEGRPLHDLVVELDHGTTITGKITGPDGSAIQGATIRVEMNEDEPGMPEGREFGNPSDAEGLYRLEAVEPGERTFLFSASNHVAETRTVELSGREMKLDVTLGKGVTVTGSVVSDTGAPVAQAYVGARGARQSDNTSARTDSAGNFRMEGIEPGTYTFQARKSGLGNGQVENVDIRTGAPVRIVMPAGATISGRVTGIEASEYSRIQVVAISDSGSETVSLSSSGAYRMDGAPTGSVRVSARRTGFGGSTTETKTVDVGSGGQAVVDLEFRNDTIVSGRVTKNRSAVDGAIVRFWPKNPDVQTRSTATTDALGDYEATGLAPGEYNVTVIGLQNLAGYSAETKVAGSTTFDIDIETTRVDGRVIDADTRQAIAAAEISLQPKGQSSGLAGRSAASDPSGIFILDDVVPGSYVVRASKPGYGQETFDLDIGRSGESGVEFELASTDGVRVRVVDGRDGRVLDATARVTDMNGRTAWEGSVRGSDKGMKIPLAAGSYRITVWASGFAAQVAGLSVPSQEATIGVSAGGKLQIQSDAETPKSGRLLGVDGQEYLSSPFSRQGLRINPGTSTIDRIAPGAYSLVVFREDGSVGESYPVTINEGRTTTLRL